ncbi:macro domain-containing protein, partial [Candidatus Sumerlaeota bacterium]|nr:macro domain-containing protein [Candidatus Sumerlaeota bacterium]
MGEPLAQFTTSGGARITLHRGDLTLEQVDAIVNAANSRLAHGGGVAGAIVRRGGIEIQTESDNFVERFGPVPVGEAAWTGPGRLRIKGIIHAVGPMWGEGDEPAKPRRA